MRNKVVDELIVTETEYIRDMGVLIGVRYCATARQLCVVVLQTGAFWVIAFDIAVVSTTIARRVFSHLE